MLVDDVWVLSTATITSRHKMNPVPAVHELVPVGQQFPSLAVEQHIPSLSDYHAGAADVPHPYAADVLALVPEVVDEPLLHVGASLVLRNQLPGRGRWADCYLRWEWDWLYSTPHVRPSYGGRCHLSEIHPCNANRCGIRS